MSLLITPGQFQRRAELYHQISQLTSAGIGLLQALQIQQRSPPSKSFRKPLAELLDHLKDGSTFAGALEHVSGWLPRFDVALLQAGEMSGRLSECFRLLADYYQERASLIRQLISDTAYPLFLLHFAIFILPFPQLFLTGELAPYLLKTFGVLTPLYLASFVTIYAAQAQRAEGWRSFVESILSPLPIIGRARRNLALARLSTALEALITAGVSIFEAWDLAAAASGSPALERTVTCWRPELESGRTPGELVNESRQFPETFSHLYNTGEITGQLDDALRRLHVYYQEEGTRQLRALATWSPRVIYLVVALFIAYKVVSFYAGYFGQATFQGL